MARVLVLSNHYPPHAYGGYEYACYDAVNRWTSKGHHVAVITSDHVRTGIEEGDAAGSTVWRRLPMTWIQSAPPPKWQRPRVERRARRALRNAIDTWRPDVVSVWNMAGLPLSLLSELSRHHVGVVAVVADNWPVRAPLEDPWVRPLAEHPRLAPAIAAITRVSATRPDLDAGMTFAFVSESIRAQCQKDSPWTFPSSEVVPLGVNLNEFPIVAPHVKPWCDKLLYVGRLDASKGVDTAVRAMAQLPNAMHLDVVGPPEALHLTRLRRVAVDAGVAERVHFSSVPRHELVTKYRAADALIFPSEWAEPFGIVPLEAMASGATVIATGTGGSGDYLVDDENCVLFPPGDATALARAITRVAADAGLRRRLMDNGQATAQRLTISETADRLEHLHASVLAEITR